MTQEDKELLLKDLCSRLPYGVKVHINSPIEEQNSMELFDVNFASEHIGVGNKKYVFRAIPIIDDEDEAKVVKPYLRPMSSITEEERRKLNRINNEGLDEWLNANNPIEKWSSTCRIDGESVDYMNSRHLDYRGLIDKGLALEAPDGMYDLEKK